MCASWTRWDGIRAGRGRSCGARAASPTNPAPPAPSIDPGLDLIDDARQREHLRWFDGGNRSGPKGTACGSRNSDGGLSCPPCMRMPSAHAPPRLRQFFVGREIRHSAAQSSDGDTVPLMGISGAATARGIEFPPNILPFARDRDLIEVTSFAPPAPERADYARLAGRGNLSLVGALVEP